MTILLTRTLILENGQPELSERFFGEEGPVHGSTLYLLIPTSPNQIPLDELHHSRNLCKRRRKTQKYQYLDYFKILYAAAAAKLRQSCPTLCDPIDGSPKGSSVPGILQARTLEWVAISLSNAVQSESEVAQSCPTRSDPMDCSLPGSSAHGVFQARLAPGK